MPQLLRCLTREREREMHVIRSLKFGVGREMELLEGWHLALLSQRVSAKRKLK